MRRTAKKPLDTSPPAKSVAAFLAAQKNDPKSKIRSVTEMEGNWRFIDFQDPFTGLPSITQEYMLGSRGWKAGSVNQFRALWSKGKSSYCYLQYGAGFQKNKAICFHIETEGTGMTPDRVRVFGVSPDVVGTAKVFSLEDCVETVDDFICRVRGGFGGSKGELGRQVKSVYTDPFDPDMKFPIMIGIDSMSALGKDDEVRQDIVDISKSGGIADKARSVRKWLKDRAGRFSETQTCVFLTSHETKKIETGMAARFAQQNDKSSEAGEGIGMYDSTAIDFSSGKWRDSRTKEELGLELKLHVFKNKLNWHGRQVSLFLTKMDGFDLVHSDAVFLVDHPMSPFKAASKVFPGDDDHIRRTPQGIRCELLSDKCYRYEEDFIADFYENEDLLATVRNGLFVKGYGLPWEERYKDRFDSDGSIVRAEKDPVAVAAGAIDANSEQLVETASEEE